jgi:hypothetical protein
LESKIVVEVEYTDKDIRDALFQGINKINQFWVVTLCVFIAIGCVLILEFRNEFSNYFNGMITLFLIAYFVFIFYCYINPMNKYVELYRRRKYCTYIFSNESIELVRPEIQSTGKWSIFNKAFELKKYFILVDTNRALTIIPKRAFKNESDIEGFRNLIKENITNVKIMC